MYDTKHRIEMNPLDLRPYFKGLEHVVRVDEMYPAYISPLQEHIIHACQQKFRLPPETRSFPPDQVYVTLMQLSPLWVHGRPLGQGLYRALCGRMSDHWFVMTEQSLFTCLALALQQEVYVCYNMHQLLPIGSDAPFHSAVLDSLDPVYGEGSGLVLWRARFCLENFDVISLTGPVSYLIEFFFNPRLMPVDYLERTKGQNNKFPYSVISTVLYS